jgi:hypothetical protein
VVFLLMNPSLFSHGLRWLLLPLAMLMVGCASKKRETPLAARFYLEAGETEAGVPVVMPRTDLRVRVLPQPVLSEYDVRNVELAEVEMGRCLQFEFSGSAADALRRLSAQHPGRRVVLVLDGEPIGVRVLDEPLPDGRLLVFVQRPDSELPALVARLKRSADTLQRDSARKS